MINKILTIIFFFSFSINVNAQNNSSREKALKETNYREEDVREKLNQLDFEKYMMNITKEEFMSLLL